MAAASALAAEQPGGQPPTASRPRISSVSWNFHNLGGGKFKDVTRESGFEKAPGKGMGISIADFNRDGHVDQDDLDMFENCATGPGIPWAATAQCQY